MGIKSWINSQKFTNHLIPLILISVPIIFLFISSQPNLHLSQLRKKASETSIISKKPTPKPTLQNTPIPTISRQSVPVISTIQQPDSDWGKTIKLNDKTSASKFGPDDHMSTVDELNQAMNQYRQVHGLPNLNPHPTLCYIAQSRANELQQLGKLDSHAGAEKYMYQQRDFNTIDEVLFGGVQPVAGVHIVEWGWDKSLTGHHEAISDPRWRDGCAGIAGLFAVFEFGEK